VVCRAVRMPHHQLRVTLMLCSQLSPRWDVGSKCRQLMMYVARFWALHRRHAIVTPNVWPQEQRLSTCACIDTPAPVERIVCLQRRPGASTRPGTAAAVQLLPRMRCPENDLIFAVLSDLQWLLLEWDDRESGMTCASPALDLIYSHSKSHPCQTSRPWSPRLSCRPQGRLLPWPRQLMLMSS